MKDSQIISALNRAKELRATGLSLLATARATGLFYETVLKVCHGITPAINLPDLPGMTMPADIAPKRRADACPPEVVNQIRQMRQDRYSRAEIARALGVSVSTVAKHSGLGPNTRPAGKDGRVKVTTDMHQEIRRLRYAKFLTCDKIAAVTGLSVDTVRRYVKIEPQ